eukprot:828012_1
MSTNQTAEKWIHLTAFACDGYVILPTGTGKNNYIATGFNHSKINSISRYNTNTDKWTKINHCNDIESAIYENATFDVKKQILSLVCKCHITQIQLNNGNMCNNTHDIETNGSTSIIVNNSLFIIGGVSNKSIFKWNSE